MMWKDLPKRVTLIIKGCTQQQQAIDIRADLFFVDATVLLYTRTFPISA
jgi:hypothetical protein